MLSSTIVIIFVSEKFLKEKFCPFTVDIAFNQCYFRHLATLTFYLAGLALYSIGKLQESLLHVVSPPHSRFAKSFLYFGAFFAFNG